jgi:ribonucleoside-diphosphate reductase alpha chain
MANLVQMPQKSSSASHAKRPGGEAEASAAKHESQIGLADSSVRQVRRRDGSFAQVDPARLRADIAALFREAGSHTDKAVDQATTQILSRLDRHFGGRATPTTDDLAHVIAITLIDNNVGFAVKRYFERLMPTVAKEGGAFDGKGLKFSRVFTQAGVHPYDELEWEKRDAVIKSSTGKVVFEQKEVETPKAWSQSATNIVVSKYFRGEIGKPERETSVKQMIDRVSQTIARWGAGGGYFSSADAAETFEAELTYMLVNQYAAFNSPVWFNVGVSEKPQCSACFINSVDDDMRSILNLAVTEGMLFKFGSGTGTNLSALRSSKEKLSRSSGKSSGPVSFMKGFDAFAGVIKSGGKTRRAAKMVILNVDHPDIQEFIRCKVKEERKAKALIELGYDGAIDGEAYSSVFFQNANNSVRVTDDFMRAVVGGQPWQTKAVMDGRVMETLPAKQVMREMAEAAWECGDPGIQYDTTVNNWNPVMDSGRINGSNPCSEYMFLDNSACNLASLNLMKFRGEDGEFDAEAFSHAVDVLITAQEIIVGSSSYPTPSIEQNSHDYRPLGIGYANLGALLMSRGLAYDSDEGRNIAAAITSLMSGRAYRQSACLAEVMGSFRFFERNREPFMRVIGQHRAAAREIAPAGVPQGLFLASRQAWDEARSLGDRHGYRNAQVSLLAPTGTIGFLMDCDTTGIEPDIALVKYKWLVGGGLMKIVNNTVPEALYRLGYSTEERHAIMDWIDEHDTIEGAPGLRAEHLAVFDCAFKPASGSRSIHYLGHLRMMAAVQPFLSGAISKTVNLPSEATVEDVEAAYIEGWKMGLKAIAVYRDGSKGQQALTTSKEAKKNEPSAVAAALEGKGKEETLDAARPHRHEDQPINDEWDTAVRMQRRDPGNGHKPLRRRLPDERKSITHKFSIAGHEGYITVGLYDDGRPGELFIRMAKGGTVVAGLLDAFATTTAIALQYGVPLRVLCAKFVHLRFEPSGFTTNPNIRIAKSIMDYIFRWLALKFLSVEDQVTLGVNVEAATLGDRGQDDMNANASPSEINGNGHAAEAAPPARPTAPMATIGVPTEAGGNEALTSTFSSSADAPVCDTCGSLMVRNGACYKCLNCGSTSGCS